MSSIPFAEQLAERRAARKRAEFSDTELVRLSRIVGFDLNRADPVDEWDAITLSASWLADVMDALYRDTA